VARDLERRLDAVIVGAGAIGLAVAWRAAERGLRVRVLERDEPAAGASGVAAGMLAPVGEASWGEERMLELTMRSHRLWPRFAADLARAGAGEIGYLPRGALHVALDRDELAELRRRFELIESLGLGATWERAGGCRELEPGLAPALAGGMHAPHEAGVDPRALTRALAEAATGAGAELRLAEEGDVIEALLDGNRIRGVRTADGREHHAPATVIAAGAWSGAEWLPPAARPAIRPVKGQILTLGGPDGARVCERIVVTERVYVVPRADGRLVVGATVEEQGFDTRVTAGGVHELLREAYRVLPEIEELELVETVAGLRPAAPDNLPLVDRGALAGLVLATGHFRNGILLAPWTAERVADLLEIGPGEGSSRTGHRAREALAR
jgi:glycine oxidase